MSNGYNMRQLLGKIMDAEVEKIVEAWPKGWGPVAFFC